ncbi:MAG TPA: serine hydrolase domain-containing protein, partial [Bauldia sp.]|nr:serine hydrolase domain-containing protein [Bauldia sp.]
MTAAIGLPGGRAEAGTADQLQVELAAAVAADPTHLPGAILYASRPGKGTFLVAAGVADIATRTPLATDAHFRAGSILKTLISVVILQLVEEGRLGLDEPIAGLLPADVASRFPKSAEITVRMLLNHTSGIPEWLDQATVGEIAANPARIWTAREFIDRAAARQALFAPGKAWSYSNTDYNLAGLIVEKVTGKPWRDAVAERVIARLKLGGTSLPAPGTVAL